MKKSRFLVFTVKAFGILAALIIGSFFLLNLVIIPKIIIPKITKTVNTQLGQPLMIKSILLSPQGTITLHRPVIYAPDGKQILAALDSIRINPSYRTILASWRKNKNKLAIPLDIKISAVTITQEPVSVSGDAQANFLVNVDRNDTAAISWSGTLALLDWRIAGIPVLGDIEDISGTINISQDSISSSDIYGKINDSPAYLKFTLHDFNAPELSIEGSFSPLLFTLHCGLKNNVLSIKEAKAAYEQIALQAHGEITNIHEAPSMALNADIALSLEELKKLPLEIQSMLTQLKPSGAIQANLRIQGPLQEVVRLNGSVTLNAPEISVLDYHVKDLMVRAHLKDGRLETEQCTASFLESAINAQLKLTFRDGNLPFESTIDVQNMKLENIKNSLALQQRISGMLNAQLTCKGEAANMAMLTLRSRTTLHNVIFDTLTLPPQINVEATLSLQNLKDMIIHNGVIDDGNSRLSLRGHLNSIQKPYCDLNGTIDLNLAKLRLYNNIALPENYSLNGTAGIHFSLKGPATVPEKMETAFKMQSDKIAVNQLTAGPLAVQGTFKDMRLDISSLSAALYSGELTAKAGLDLSRKEKPSFTLSAFMNGMNIGIFGQQTKLIPPDFQGKLSSELTASGSGFDPRTLHANLTAGIRLEDGRAQGIPLENVYAKTELDYGGQNLNLKECALTYKTITLSAQGMIASILGAPRIDIIARTSLDLADLEKLPIDLDPILKPLTPSGIIQAEVKATGPIADWASLKINSHLSSEKLGIKDVFFEDLNFSGNLINKLLELSLQSTLYDGTLTAHVNADFLSDNFTYKVNAQAKEVNIGRLIKESQIIAQAHEGIVSLNTQAEGIGSDLNTLKGTANIQLSEAKIAGLELMKAIAAKIGAHFLADFEVTQANGDFSAENMRVATQNTQCIGPDATLIPRGSVGFNQQLHDFTVTIILTPSGAQKINSTILKRFFIYKNDAYQRTFPVEDTLSQPKINWEQLMQDVVQEKIEEKKDEAKEKIKEGVEKILKKGLKDLFGR